MHVLSMRLFVQEWVLCRYDCLCAFDVYKLCCNADCTGYELCMLMRSRYD